MSYNLDSLNHAISSLTNFLKIQVSVHHKRFFFPYLCGTYFCYRKLDVLRLLSIISSISDKQNSTRYLDVGCSNGDFLRKMRTVIPTARGIEKNYMIYYLLKKPIPHYLDIFDIRYGLKRNYDVIFVGWMDPGEDFRKIVASKTDVVITTLDQGLSLFAEYEEYGFEKIASWKTPSWEDINIQLSNRYYSNLEYDQQEFLSKLRGLHNYWYVYSKKKSKSDLIIKALKNRVKLELEDNIEPYEFEKVLDICGYIPYKEYELEDNKYLRSIWEINFN